MNPTTFTSRAAAGLVAGIAGFASYNHIVSVARDAGEHGAVAAVLPLSIDGLIVVGTMAMIDDKKHGRRPRWSARVALGFGVVATLAANIASAEPGLKAALVAAAPALAFLIAVEVLARTGRPITQPDVTEPPVQPPAETVGAPAGEVAVPWLHAFPIGPPPHVLADKLSSPKAPRKRPPSSKPDVIAAHKKSPNATNAQLAARLNVSEQTVKRHRPKPVADSKVNGKEPVLQDAPA